MILLTIKDAYDATQHYIERYYAIADSDDAAILAGNMMLMENGKPFDPAIYEDWLSAFLVIKPLENLQDENPMLTIDEAYSLMIKFLEIYCSMGADDSFIGFVKSLKTRTSTVLTFQDWINSVQEITSHAPRIRPLFKLLPKE